MKKIGRVILGAGLVIATTFVTATYIIGSMVYNGSVGSEPEVSQEAMAEHYSTEGDKPLFTLENYKYEKFFINSAVNEYDIEGISIKSNIESDDVMVLVHGIESNYHEVLNSAFNYLENGYNVVTYHQRQTGGTGGEEYTFGLHERFDLDAIVNYTAELYPNGLLGVHGYSMGAATSTFHTQLNEEKKNVDFYILDGPYHTMESAINLGIIGENIPFLPVSYAAWAGELYIKSKAGFSFDDVQPYKAVENVTVPVMLIHGTEDKITDPESSKIIYDTIPHDNKELWLIDGLGHCEADDEIEEEYFARIRNFIDEEVR